MSLAYMEVPDKLSLLRACEYMFSVSIMHIGGWILLLLFISVSICYPENAAKPSACLADS